MRHHLRTAELMCILRDARIDGDADLEIACLMALAGLTAAHDDVARILDERDEIRALGV